MQAVKVALCRSETIFHVVVPHLWGGAAERVTKVL